MIRFTQSSNEKLKIELTRKEASVLEYLYKNDGAWTRNEAISHLGESRFNVLLRARVLGRQNTDMGDMYHLLARGRLSVYDSVDACFSLQSQLDVAYVRLSLQQLGWGVLRPAKAGEDTLYKGYATKFPKMKFTEVASPFGRALVAGKITGQGYSSDGINRIAQVVRSSALHDGFTVAILTPHTRRGIQAAERHKTFMRIVHVLPGESGTSRFNPVQPPDQLPDQGPFLSGPSIAQFREARTLRDVTLNILALTRSERIEQAQAALDVDRAVSASQLKRHYGLEPEDLTGRLVTSTIVRPVKGRNAVEVQQRIVVADRKVARLEDGDLVHRLTTAQIRLQLGIPADPDRWIVESRGSLPVEEPDAIYLDAQGGRHAIEADTGFYSVTTVLRKLESFHDQAYQETIWGAVSDTRIKNLTRQIAQDRKPRFLNAKWWL